MNAECTNCARRKSGAPNKTGGIDCWTRCSVDQLLPQFKYNLWCSKFASSNTDADASSGLMIPPLSTECKDRVQQHLFEGRSPQTVADVEGIHVCTVRKIRRNINTWGTHTAPPVARRGRPYKILPIQ